MRVLQIVPSVSLVYGGPSQMILGLSTALAQAGVELTLITTDSNGDKGEPCLDVPLGEAIAQDGYSIIYFHCSPWRRYKFSPHLLAWLWNHSQEYQIAHIHALFSPVSTAAATIARFRNLPYLLRPLGTLDPADLNKKKVLKQLYGRWLEKPNLAGAGAVHFTSEQECLISERFEAKTRDVVVPLGVSIPEKLPPVGKTREELGIGKDELLLLFMSRVDPKKGLDLLIPALERLSQEGIEFRFVLAGANPQDPNYEAEIRERINQSCLGKRTIMTGFVEGDLKYGLLQDADLFILPSYYENFGIAVAEAMGMGTAVVISDQVHIWEEVTTAEAGWVSKGQVVEVLLSSLKAACLDREERERRGNRGRQLVKEKYSWSAIADQLLTIYQNLIDSNQSMTKG